MKVAYQVAGDTRQEIGGGLAGGYTFYPRFSPKWLCALNTEDRKLNTAGRSGPVPITYRSPRRSGFTLVELLVVISIIAILIALLLPALAAARATALNILCESNLKQTWLSYDYYANDNQGFIPHGADGPPGSSGQPWNTQGYNPNDMYSGQANYLTGSHSSNHLPRVYQCPLEATMDSALDSAGNVYSDGTVRYATYWPNVDFWANTARMNYPKNMFEYGPYTVPVSASDAPMLGEASSLGQDSFGNSNVTNFYSGGIYLWDFDPGSFFNYHYNGNYSNMVYFDGHVGKLLNGTINNQNVQFSAIWDYGAGLPLPPAQ